jgi:MFS superfamily sulfate permease-like transporter
MSKQQIHIRNIVLVLIILATAAMRLISYQFPVLSNFTPVGAMALFAGAYFTDKWKAFLVPVLALFVSDIFINYLYTSKWVFFYSSSIWVYLVFILMVAIGTLIKKVNFSTVALASVASVVMHWLIMDLPWLYGNQYTHDLSGYLLSLQRAIPFERNMVLGDAIYGIILFGGFELAQHRYTFLSPQKEMAV